MRVVVIAIRGTATLHDWLVNFNHSASRADTSTKPTDKLKSYFLVSFSSQTAIDGSTYEFQGRTEDNEPYKIHSGFLAAAQSMAPKVAALLTEMLSDGSISPEPLLLFTGHSAGGAVAALLYAHMFRCPTPNAFSPLLSRLATAHCMTFGSPPVISPPIAPFLPRSTFVSFINEGDPILRCGPEYVNSLLRLWVSHMPKESVKWEVPGGVLSNAGSIVGIPKERDQDGGTLFVAVDGKDLNGRLFGDPKMHKMDVYLST
jgi:hypothetical protein